MRLIDSLQGLNTFDERFFTDGDFAGLHAAADVLKAWFAECWWKAGGWSYPIPTGVRVHDDYGDAETVSLTECS